MPPRMTSCSFPSSFSRPLIFLFFQNRIIALPIYRIGNAHFFELHKTLELLLVAPIFSRREPLEYPFNQSNCIVNQNHLLHLKCSSFPSLSPFSSALP